MIEKIDLRQIALYLAGSLPPYYDGNKKVRFFRVFNNLDDVSYSIEKLEFFERQVKGNDVEYYFMILEDFVVQNKKTDEGVKIITNILQELDIPSELFVVDVKMSETIFDRQKLLQDWNTLKLEKKSQTKGKMFEDFLKNLFQSTPGLSVLDIKQAKDEQIDLWIKNDIPGTFWSSFGSPIIIGEAKNRTKPTPSEVVKTLIGKQAGHKSVCKLGLLISMNGFTNTTEASANRISNEFTIVFIESHHIESLLSGTQSISDRFETIVIDSISS